MSENTTPTLNSRLRVLIAKTYRAEKLYASMLNVGEGGLPSGASLNKLANDVRAKEWQVQHEQLRSGLNELVRLGHHAAVLDHLEVLHEEYYARYMESSNSLARGVAALVETARRQEFAHVLKLSLDMARYKARSQACKVIADELAALIEESGRVNRLGDKTRAAQTKNGLVSADPDGSESQKGGSRQEADRRFSSMQDLPVTGEEMEEADSLRRKPLAPEDLGAKIIPLRRRGSDSSLRQR